MKALYLILDYLYLLNIFIISGVFGANFQLFTHSNFTGLRYESKSTANCNNIPFIHPDGDFSLQTDTCLIAYQNPNCNSLWSDKYMPGDHVVPISKYIYSFHFCNEKEGGNQLNVDITKLKEDKFDVLEKYKNICSCVNVPEYVKHMDTWSINNHHNDLLAYYEPDCSASEWNPDLIVAGRNGFSNFMHSFYQTDAVTRETYKYQSFGPNPESHYFQNSCNSTNIALENPESEQNITESEPDVYADLNKYFQDLTTQIDDLETEVDHLNENIENITKQQFDYITETNTKIQHECNLKQEFLLDKFQMLEKGQERLENKMEAQRAEILNAIFTLQALLRDKLKT